VNKKILSIDFDYFIQATKEAMENFPDGVDHSTELSTLIWASYYLGGRQAALTKSVGILEEEFSCIKRILRKQSPDVPVMITNSHVNAYNFIHNYVSDDEKLLLVNIDMHHDIVNSNKHLDCGNWISFLLEEYEMKLNWVASPVSFQMYGFDKTSEENEILKNLITPNLAIIEDKDYKYDGIFLCRSDTWTPPHLDKYFSSLCNIIAKRFNNVVAEEGIRQCRVYKPITEQLRKSIKNFNTETE